MRDDRKTTSLRVLGSKFATLKRGFQDGGRFPVRKEHEIVYSVY